MAMIIDDLVNLFLGMAEAEEQKEKTQEHLRETYALPTNIHWGSGYSPEMYGPPEEARYKTLDVPEEDRIKQMEALQKLQDLSEGRIASQTAYDRQKALMDAANMAKGQTDAALANAQARGVGGSGLEFALRNQGGQAAANQAMEGGMQSAAQAALERMQAGQNYLQGLHGVRSQDYQQAANNADIINKFNMYNTQQRNAINQQNVNARNAAQQFNVSRNDKNASTDAQLKFQRQQMINQFLNPEKTDISASYAPIRQINNAWGNYMQQMAASGIGGGMGGQIGGSMGGAMGSQMGAAAGKSFMNQAMPKNPDVDTEVWADSGDWGWA